VRCSFSGCSKAVHSRGLCGAHYQQRRLGKVLAPLQQQFHGLSEIDRLMTRVAKQPTGCWKWLGSIKSRKNRPSQEWHGQWRNVAGQIELTSRAAWRLLVGPIPTRALVLHKCDVAQCVNPDHLYLGTQADNVRDMWDRGRARPGVSRGSVHGMSKLDEVDVKAIRTSGESGPAIARRYGISTTQVYDIRNRRSWTHIK
jgi:hypothetical protein